MRDPNLQPAPAAQTIAARKREYTGFGEGCHRIHRRIAHRSCSAPRSAGLKLDAMSYLRPTFVIHALVALPLLLPALAMAHGGPPLDGHGCHADRVRGQYHCHLRELKGRVFKSRGAMLEAIESGDLPSPTQKSAFEGLFGGGDSKATAETAEPTQTEDTANQAVGAVPATPSQPQARTIEDRLRILQGLHEMGLITETEHDRRRAEILQEL
ncbi:MAG: hypothetical protein ACI8TX_002485 [Hyphomicrobiaceae bacterium]